MENKKSVTELEKELAASIKNSSRIREALESERLRLNLPELKKKYEGKYFKYRNSMGGDNKKWWMYVYCEKVIDDRQAVFNTFQTNCFGESDFKIAEHGYYHLADTKISKAEYTKALNRFKAEVNQL